MKNIIQRFNVIARNEAIHNLLDCFTLRVRNDARYVIVALTLLWGVGGLVGCNWLDIVPDDLPTIDDAFSNRATTRKFLFTCYSYLPNPSSNLINHPAFLTSRDEFEYGSHSNIIVGPGPCISRGEQNSNDPYLNFWSGRNGGTALFRAIRDCNVFLEKINQPRDIPDDERKRWIAEVKFLKAYYHFFLMQLYGPIPLVKENIPISASPDEVRVFREPVDECIAYIVQLIDDAVVDLPPMILNNYEEDGRITQPIALSVKAKALVWGASPLFNGNTDYRNWIDSRNKQLISDTYSPEKWEKAAEAIQDAIGACHAAGHKLYQFDKAAMGGNIANMNDSLVLTMHTRKGISERWNTGIVWSSTVNFSAARNLFPPMFSDDWLIGASIGVIGASFNMAETFYTKNGIPIDEDPEWNYTGRYALKISTVEAGNGSYIAIGQQTASLHFDREPRFYASMAFDRGYVEIATAAQNMGASYAPFLRLRASEPGQYTYPLPGYFAKKMIAYETSASQGAQRPYIGYDYRFPLVRLADLYLLYSEALNEIKDAPDAEVYEWIDYVRAITGLKGVVASWENSMYPDRPKDKTEMRKIIQQERMIELAFEGQRFWDVRRWKTAGELWKKTPKAWNYKGNSAEDFYTVTDWVTEPRNFTFRDYLWPISISDLIVNKNLEQTYGW